MYPIKDGVLEKPEVKKMPKNNKLAEGWGLAYHKRLDRLLGTDGSSKI